MGALAAILGKVEADGERSAAIEVLDVVIDGRFEAGKGGAVDPRPSERVREARERVGRVDIGLAVGTVAGDAVGVTSV